MIDVLENDYQHLIHMCPQATAVQNVPISNRITIVANDLFL